MKKILLSLCFLVLLVGCSTSNQAQTEKNEDKIAPVINVKNYVFETTVGRPVNLDTATALDAVDGPIDVRILGTVDFNQSGEYYLEYLAIDLNGNESKTPFTVVVKEQTTDSETTSSGANTNQVGCDASGAYDNTLPCNRMISDVNDMVMIFQDQDGYASCVGKIEELNDESVKYECVQLYRNDQKTWGYGLQKKEN